MGKSKKGGWHVIAAGSPPTDPRTMPAPDEGSITLQSTTEWCEKKAIHEILKIDFRFIFARKKKGGVSYVLKYRQQGGRTLVSISTIICPGSLFLQFCKRKQRNAGNVVAILYYIHFVCFFFFFLLFCLFCCVDNHLHSAGSILNVARRLLYLKYTFENLVGLGFFFDKLLE